MRLFLCHVNVMGRFSQESGSQYPGCKSNFTQMISSCQIRKCYQIVSKKCFTAKSEESIVQIQKHNQPQSTNPYVMSEAKVISNYLSISSSEQQLNHSVCQSLKMYHPIPILIHPLWQSPEPFTIPWWRWWWWWSSQGTHGTVTKVFVRYVKHFTCWWQ